MTDSKTPEANSIDDLLKSLSNSEGRDLHSDIIFMAGICESSERHDDMCVLMHKLVTDVVAKNNTQLKDQDRNLLSVAYKNCVGHKRAAWRVAKVFLEDKEQQEKEGQHETLKLYVQIIQNEIQAVCNEVLELLNNILIPLAQNAGKDTKPMSLVFYLKMAGDYYRYMAELKCDPSHGKLSQEKYEAAFKVATAEGSEGLPATHPIRLGLALNYSVCYYEILDEQDKACNIAKNAFDKAISQLDKLDEPSYKDSTLIMQLLRDNLTLWTSTNDPEVQVKDLDQETNGETLAEDGAGEEN